MQTLQKCLVWECFIPVNSNDHIFHIFCSSCQIWSSGCSFACIGDVLSENYDIMCNEGHVWAVNQGTLAWPGPDHRENIWTATPSSSSSFHSSSRCPQKMLKAVSGKSLPLVSVRNSFILTGPRGKFWDEETLSWKADTTEWKNEPHFRFTSNFCSCNYASAVLSKSPDTSLPSESVLLWKQPEQQSVNLTVCPWICHPGHWIWQKAANADFSARPTPRCFYTKHQMA